VTSPEVSVIVTAHDRKIFLKEAVESVLKQTLARNKYEIVVVKNFEDDEIESFLSENRVITLFSDTEFLGKDKALGIQASKGDIICFLDDDDLFLPNKLETVMSTFNEKKDLIFFRNNPVFFNEEGTLPELIRGARKMHEAVSPKYGDILRYVSERAPFNSSCISIRRELISRNIEFFEGVKNVVDYYLFVLACNSGKRIIQSPNLLTKYRVAAGMSTSRPRGNIQEFIRKTLKVKTNEYNDLRQISNLANKKEVSILVSMEVDFLGLYVNLFSEKNERKKLVWYSIRYIKCMLSIPSKYNPYFLAYSFISIFNKKFVQRIIYSSTTKF